MRNQTQPYRLSATFNMKKQLLIYLCILFCLHSYAQSSQSSARNTYKQTSVLSEGLIHKISVPGSGIYRIDYEFLSNAFGSELSSIAASQLQIWGNPGGMIPEKIQDERIDDLEELPLKFIGDGDEEIEQGEYYLFYCEGPNKLKWQDNSYVIPKNIYSNENFYFLISNGLEGKRLESLPSSQSPEVTFREYDNLQIYELDLVNLLGRYSSTIGSGKKWFGDNYSNLRSQVLTDKFDFTRVVPGSDINMEAEIAIRSNKSSTAVLSLNETNASKTVSSVDISQSLAKYARIAKLSSGLSAPEGVELGESDFTLQLDVNNGGSVFEAFLDFVRLDLKRELVFNGAPLTFYKLGEELYSSVEFELEKLTNNVEIWQIDDPFETVQLQPSFQNTDVLRFSYSPSGTSRFIAFDPGAHLPIPSYVGHVANQNLHGVNELELLIIYYDEFEEAALLLADHRRTHDGMNVVAYPISKVFNEFGGGSPDPTAIRDFAKMVYDRVDEFKYLCLFGDGSYDYKGLNDEIPYSNLVPVFETPESLDPIESFPTDDYYALLSDNEGGNLVGAIDIAVGRIPVMTSDEAMDVVNKLIRYDLSEEALGDWWQRIGFVADDEDNNQHLNQSIELSNRIESLYPRFNHEKIFFDAYPQVSTVGDARFPDANAALNNSMFKGLLTINYYGHGGPKGWAQERVLELADVNSWVNTDRYPLFITATCTFTGYDDPEARSGGELTFINPNGGAIGLVTTVRAVYSNSNKVLTYSLFDRLYEQDPDGDYLPLGEILRQSKNSNRQDTLGSNARKFTLIGDPSMRLALPEYKIETTHINEKEVGVGSMDTLGALKKVTIKGHLTDFNGQKAIDFNGDLFSTVFDKKKTLTTLGQDPKSYPKEFEVQNNILFKGQAHIESGAFELTFVIPKDIDYSYGHGRISYYARSDKMKDAGGYFDDFIIGGSSDQVFEDDEGPIVELFMNSEDFISGGITGPDPILIVKLFDENGINVSGNSIGHDLIGILDEDTQNSFVMNDYYEANIDDFRKGTVYYPLSDLQPGVHRIMVRAWDVANNMAEGELSFEVLGHENPQFLNTLSFPNPFTDRTRFVFEHNLTGKEVEIQLDIHDVLGRPIWSISEDLRPAAHVYDQLEWDGTDHNGGKVQPGVYIYRMLMKTLDGSGNVIESNIVSGQVVFLGS